MDKDKGFDYETISRAVLQQPYTFGITDKSGKEKKFSIKPPCLGCLLKISEILINVNYDEIAKSKDVFNQVVNHTDSIVETVCLLIQNSDRYPKWLFDYVKNNLTAAELFELFSETIARLGVADFQKSIIASQAMSLLSDRSRIAGSIRGSSQAV